MNYVVLLSTNKDNKDKEFYQPSLTTTIVAVE